MSYILVVFQIISMTGSYSQPVRQYGWTPIGEFYTHESCVEASKTLAAPSQLGGVVKFECLHK